MKLDSAVRVERKARPMEDSAPSLGRKEGVDGSREPFPAVKKVEFKDENEFKKVAAEFLDEVSSR